MGRPMLMLIIMMLTMLELANLKMAEIGDDIERWLIGSAHLMCSSFTVASLHSLVQVILLPIGVCIAF